MKERICEIKDVFKGQHVVDGAGVHINRIIGSRALSHVDPFVLLDEIRSSNPEDYIAGFPTHPHRGIETITYMVRGRFRHRDSRGGGGLLTDGCVQWMTAGRGILHSEMPEKIPGELMGYQLWLSLPQRHKMVPPRYRHLSPETIPRHREKGVDVAVISGSYGSSEGKASNWVPTEYFDVRIAPGAIFRHTTQPESISLCYVHSGSISVCGTEVPRGRLIIFTAGRAVEIGSADEKTGLLFLTGRPNNEPIVRGGPFVMNTEAEIEKAFEDYRTGRLF